MNQQSPPSHEQALISVTQAQQQILELVKSVTETETVALNSAINRVLAENVISKIDLPGFDNSAMDGYALSSKALKKSGPDQHQDQKITLNLAGESFAGIPYQGEVVKTNECIRIMTGALLPPGCDLIIMQEQVTRHEKTIEIGTEYQAGDNVRHKGEDVRAGTQVLDAGKLLTPADIGLLAATGQASVQVYRKPRVAFFSTGDELRSLSDTLQAGQIYDSNRYMLNAMLSRMHVEVIDLGVIADDKQAIKSTLQTTAAKVDAIITSGGVSVGEADFVKQVLDEIGQIHFWRVAMKPGKPLAIGTIADCFFFGLPGNPVSVFATFYQFVQTALFKIMGTQAPEPIRFQARCLTELKKKPGRAEFQRGKLQRNKQGELEVASTGGQGSHVLSTLSQADCFILLSAENTGIKPGEMVEVQPLFGLV